MLKEFKEFALRGNVMDLAIGVIIGAAFGTIVNSIVNDLIMPLVGTVFKADFSNLPVQRSRQIALGSRSAMPVNQSRTDQRARSDLW